MKDRFVVYYVKIVVYELFLHCSVIPLYAGVYLGAIGIREVMRDILFLKLDAELA